KLVYLYLVNYAKKEYATEVDVDFVRKKGLEISGTFTHRQGHIYMEMNKNSFGVIPSTPLAIKMERQVVLRTDK
uniref:100 kDa beta-adaptin (Fragments) n=1 Tax=Bos taurus TaxID=9913 RepID=Q9TS60_BOVIN